MTKLKANILSKLNVVFASATASVLTLLLIATANAGSTIVFHEPKQPKSLDKFKLIK